jgi:hypothetical protein
MAGRGRIAALAAVFALCAEATLAQSATADTQRQAYGYAMACFVANGIVVGDMQNAGKARLADAQEAKARLSFDTAVKFGEALGYSGSRINQDFGLAQGKQLPKLVKDGAYFKQTVATCKALGLM